MKPFFEINQVQVLDLQSKFQAKKFIPQKASKVCASLLLCMSFGLPSYFLSSNLAHANSSSDLKGMASQISQHASQIAKQKKELNSLQSDLKKFETSIANINKDINQTSKELATVKANLNNLNKQKQDLEATKAKQTQDLEELIQAYYLTSRPQDITKLFQAGSSVDTDRMSQYYQAIAAERSKAIEKLEATTRELEAKEKELNAQQKKQEQLLAQQKSKQEELQGTQKKRQTTLASMKKSIQSDEVKLAELRKNEEALKRKIEEAARRAAEARRKAELKRKQEIARRKAEEERRRKAAEAAKAAGKAAPKEAPIEETAPVSLVRGPLNGLSSQKGRLPWPLKGTILHNYGSIQSGQITWKGLVIAANPGMNVRSIAPGEVVFADWLRGYGLVILVDHGRGDMSLYGYNQSLLKKEGDRVAGGEPIAKAGSSGGQDRTSLYFEIRRNSKAQNPRSWLSR